MVTVPLVLGAGIGFGVWLAIRACTPRRQPLPALLADLDRAGRPLDSPSSEPVPAKDRLATLSYRMVGDRSGASTQGAALLLTGSTPERHALGKVAGALAGLFVPVVAAMVLTTVGVPVPAYLVALVAMGAVAAGFVMPDVVLREEAEQQRRAFRHALSAYLDLVNVLLAGGAGIETSLYAAAEAGDGTGFRTIRRALQRARFTGRSPWDSLAELGRRLGVAELTELAACVSLAGSHGARIRASLAAKADSLRTHQVAEIESAAEAATERMTIPVTVMLTAFLVFVAYPALHVVTGST